MQLWLGETRDCRSILPEYTMAAKTSTNLRTHLVGRLVVVKVEVAVSYTPSKNMTRAMLFKTSSEEMSFFLITRTPDLYYPSIINSSTGEWFLLTFRAL
jgi:hypothetical protein